MNSIIKILEDQDICHNLCYRDYQINKNTILVKKSNDFSTQIIETRELIDIYDCLHKRKDIKVSVLENGDIFIKKID